jgi:hypothetical protein
MEYKYIVVYCKMHIKKDNIALENILLKAKELFERLRASYADEENIRILIFGLDDIDKAYNYLPKEQIEYFDCKNIYGMCAKIISIINDKEFQRRVYLVLLNWQWRYIEPLLRVKHEQFKFFFEGVFDPRSREDIMNEINYEKVAKIKLKDRSLLSALEGLAGNLSTDLKG